MGFRYKKRGKGARFEKSRVPSVSFNRKTVSKRKEKIEQKLGKHDDCLRSMRKVKSRLKQGVLFTLSLHND